MMALRGLSTTFLAEEATAAHRARSAAGSVSWSPPAMFTYTS